MQFSGHWESEDQLEMASNAAATNADHYQVWTRLFTINPSSPSAPDADSSVQQTAVPAGFESLFPNWRATNENASDIVNNLQPSAPSFDDDNAFDTVRYPL